MGITFYEMINREGGGVCMYIRSDLAYNPRDDINLEGVKSIWCDLLLPKSKPILLGTIYCPYPEQNQFMTKFKNMISDLSLAQETYILGDFNICTLSGSKRSTEYLNRSYIDILSGAGFSNIVKVPTRVTEISTSLLDHILCNNLGKICQSGVVPFGLSDHFLIYLTRKTVKKTSSTQNITHIRSLKRYTVEAFRNLLSDCDWSPVLNCVDVNSAWTNFKSIFTGVLDQIAPERDVRIKKRTEPWITPAILEKIRKRDKIRKALLKDNSEVTYQDFTKIRNEVQRDVKKKQKPHSFSLNLRIAWVIQGSSGKI